MSVSKINGELRKLGIKPSKKLGQHFLIDTKIAEWMVEQADIKRGEKILEIGPGLGILTERLVGYEIGIVAIEKDKRFSEYLCRKLDVKIINADVLDINLPAFDKEISNLPYQISSPFTLELLRHDFLKGVLMYQREFADHLVANPGTRAYSRLSVMAAYKAQCRVIKSVSKGSFYPVPKVDSAIVEIIPRPAEFSVESEEAFRLIVRVLFSHKNRKVRNGLVSEHRQLGMNKQESKTFADSLPRADRRPVTLSPEDLGEIADAFFQQKKDDSVYLFSK